MRRLIPLALLALAACGQSADRVPEPAATASVEPLASLAGEYRVAGIDRLELDQPYGIALSIGPERIDFDNCRQIGWTYTLEQGRLETERSPPPDASGEPCEDKLPVPVLQMVSAIDAAKSVERTPENAVLLRGGLRSVTLFSQ